MSWSRASTTPASSGSARRPCPSSGPPATPSPKAQRPAARRTTSAARPQGRAAVPLPPCLHESSRSRRAAILPGRCVLRRAPAESSDSSPAAACSPAASRGMTGWASRRRDHSRCRCAMRLRCSTCWPRPHPSARFTRRVAPGSSMPATSSCRGCASRSPPSRSRAARSTLSSRTPSTMPPRCWPLSGTRSARQSSPRIRPSSTRSPTCSAHSPPRNRCLPTPRRDCARSCSICAPVAAEPTQVSSRHPLSSCRPPRGDGPSGSAIPTSSCSRPSPGFRHVSANSATTPTPRPSSPR